MIRTLQQYNYYHKTVIVIFLATLIRLFLAYTLELGNDEVYYYFYAEHLQINYFDHPPLIAFLIRLFTINLSLQGELFVRLGAIVCAALSSFLLYRTVRELHSIKAGFYAVILYQTNLYTSLISGTFILPDSPQVLFWLLCLHFGIQILKATEQNRSTFWIWLLFGLSAGLAVTAKIHAVFIWLGMGLYILFYKRKMPSTLGFYTAAFITLLFIVPLLYWNIQHQAVTYQYHSGRISFSHPQWTTLLQAILGQIFYYNPVNALLLILGFLTLIRNRIKLQDKYIFLLLLSLPLSIVVCFLSVFNQVLPHWSGPGLMLLIIPSAIYLSKIRSVRKWIFSSCLFLSFTLIAGWTTIHFYPGTLGSKNTENFGKNDVTQDVYGWKNFSQQFEAWYLLSLEKNAIRKNCPIVVNKWFPASHIDYYVASPLKIPVYGVGKLNNLHHYAWLNHYRQMPDTLSSAICILPANFGINNLNEYKNYFSETRYLTEFKVMRSGKPARYFQVYALYGYKNNDELQSIRKLLKQKSKSRISFNN